MGEHDGPSGGRRRVALGSVLVVLFGRCAAVAAVLRTPGLRDRVQAAVYA